MHIKVSAQKFLFLNVERMHRQLLFLNNRVRRKEWEIKVEAQTIIDAKRRDYL
jgi:hypothetical protein